MAPYRSRLIAGGAFAALLALSIAWGWYGDSAPGGTPGADGGTPPANPRAAANIPQARDSWWPQLKERSPEETARWIAKESILAGTEMDGSWGVDASGRLRPTPALKHRFDYFLQLQGQIPLSAISTHVENLIRHDLSPAAAASVIDVWKRYLQLQETRFSTAADPADPDTVRRALAEQSEARRRVLGADWAEAFYGEDEASLRNDLERMAQKRPPPTPEEVNRIDPSTLDSAGAARLAEEQAAQARWRDKLEATRREVKALQDNAALNEAQRQAAIERLLAERYDNESERQRVRFLLNPSS